MTLSILKAQSLTFVRKNDYEAFFELLSHYLNPQSQAFAALIMLNSRYNALLDKEMKGIILQEEAKLEYNLIREAALHLIKILREEELGDGGELHDPLEEAVRLLPVEIPLTTLFLVNCDRRKPARTFWRSFDSFHGDNRRFQFYYVLGCPTQEPGSFSERVVYELLERELEGNFKAIDFKSRADNRLLIEPMPLGHNLGGCQKAFKKNFSERFSLSNNHASFEDYLHTGLPKLPWQYVTIVFKITADDWDQQVVAPYLQWLTDVFSHTGENIPTFIFFFLIVIKNAHREEAVRGENLEVLNGARALVQANASNAALIEYLAPVHTDDLEYWLERLGNVPGEQKYRIIELLADRLTPEERAQYEHDTTLNMERIEAFQEKVYKHHHHK